MVGGGCVLIFAAVKKKERTRSIKNVANEKRVEIFLKMRNKYAVPTIFLKKKKINLVEFFS